MKHSLCIPRVLISLAALLLLVAGVHAELLIQQVWPEKVFCKPGEAVGLQVVVANPDQAPASAHLRVELVYDLDSTIKLAEQDITIEAGQSFTWQGPWRAQPLLGLELRATLTRGGVRIARKSEYATCAASVFQVLMSGKGNHGGMQFSGTVDDSIDKYAPEFARQWRMQSGNFFDYFAWGPSDFDCLTPKQGKWWSGQACYDTSEPNIIAVFKAFHAHGMQALTYGKAAAGGVVGAENLRRRPESRRLQRRTPVAGEL